MAKTLLDILNGPYPKVEQRTPNEKGMTPLPQETGARAFLKSLKVSAYPDPYGNDDSFSAKDVSVFQRAKNRYGYDYSTQGDYNNQGSPNDHVLRNPTINVATEAFIAVDSIGLGSKTAWRVINKYTNEYVTRIMQQEDAEAIAADLNRSFMKELLQEVDEIEEDKEYFAKNTPSNKLAGGNPKNKTKHKYVWTTKGRVKNAHYEKPQKEEFESLDELSKPLLGRYVKHAGKDIGDQTSHHMQRYQGWAKGHGKKRIQKRSAGIYKALNRINAEELEHLDESVTRKHFRDVANTVRSIEDPAKRQEFANHHASIFARQNPRFDHEKFHRAAGTIYDGKGIGSKPWREEIELDEISRSRADYYIDRATRERAEGRNKHKVAKREKSVSRAMNKIYGRVGTKVHATEETELNELSPQLLGRYKRKAQKDWTKSGKGRRVIGVSRASDRLKGHFMANAKNSSGLRQKWRSKYNAEETDLTETLPANASAKDYIHDFVHSKNKMFKGDSKKEKIRRALGAYYHHKEETRSLGDVLTELSKKTLKSYYKKAKSSKEHHEFISQHRKRVGLDSKVVDREAAKRKQGMERAADRVMGAREETEINELSKKTLGSYVKKAHKDARNRSEDITARNVDVNNSHLSDWRVILGARAIHKYNKEDSHKIKNRDKGINRAVGKLTK